MRYSRVVSVKAGCQLNGLFVCVSVASQYKLAIIFLILQLQKSAYIDIEN